MTARSKRDKLKAQLVDTRRMYDLAGNHPVMSVAFAERVTELEELIEAIPLGAREAKTVLYFSGDPVQGSEGIDVSFTGRILEPFQSMVMADYASRYHGVVGTRGRRAGEADSRLLLTALPRGSFGLELTKAENDEIFEEDQLADTLSHITRLVESAAESDEEFASELNETAPRVIQNLRTFLEVICTNNAGLRLESGDNRCSINPIKAAEAFERVAATVSNSENIELQGIFKGILLESWKFDFTDESSRKISGKINNDLTEEQAAELNRQFFNLACTASFEKTTVLFRNGRERTTYLLNDLQPIE
jgi:hypothetical protein